MSDAAVGANVMYCGHDGWFVADIFKIGEVNVVHAGGPVSGDTLVRGENHRATHYITDMPTAGFWKPRIGVFVVPRNQVWELVKEKPNEGRGT